MERDKGTNWYEICLGVGKDPSILSLAEEVPTVLCFRLPELSFGILQFWACFFFKLLFYLFKSIFKILFMKRGEHVHRRQCSGGGQRRIWESVFPFLLYMSYRNNTWLLCLWDQWFVLCAISPDPPHFYFFFCNLCTCMQCILIMYTATCFQQLSSGPHPAHPPPSLMSPLL